MQRMRHLLMGAGHLAGFRSGAAHERDAYLWGLSHINMFVGANNTGKSRFLRAFLAEREPRYVPFLQLDRDTLQTALKPYLANLRSNFEFKDSPDNPDIIKYLLSGAAISDKNEFDPKRVTFVDILSDLLRTEQTMLVEPNNTPIQTRIERWISSQTPEGIIQPLYPDWPGKFQPTDEWQRLYIPVLRGLRPMPGSADPYQEATIRDFKTLSDSKCRVFTGLSLYEDVRKLLCGTHSERKSIQRFESYLSETFFRGETVALIPRHQDGRNDRILEIKIGAEPQHPIHSLGDGIQAIIAITFPLFTKSREKMLVGIEEPELNLHPGMQRTLIEALRRFSDCQFFLATHSNHFLDLTLESDDLSVYTFEKYLPPGDNDERHAIVTITPVSHGDSRTLQLLGTRNSSVFLANCTIWVEGITDRRYFSHYLRLYQEHLLKQAKAEDKTAPQSFQEDLHFAFVEYGGSNITHWSWLDDTPDPIEVERLCGRLMLIADNDGAAKETKKAERHRQLSERLTSRFVLLECREVENLIGPVVMRKYLTTLRVTDADSVVEDWDQYRSLKLGKWIDKTLAIAGVKARKHEAKSGTIEDKGIFAEAIIRETAVFEELSPEAQAICERIYNFISENQNRVAN